MRAIESREIVGDMIEYICMYILTCPGKRNASWRVES
jgi:hypothetical protein